jgi:alkanesulfonate monooxygenase SsuD/methylene tetrahydromethanopterin reductase-like flavin-dependent oxidoreductase (luciferase family)
MIQQAIDHFGALQPDADVPLRQVQANAVPLLAGAVPERYRDRDWTPQQIASSSGWGHGSHHLGSPATVADELERWADVGDSTPLGRGQQRLRDDPSGKAARCHQAGKRRPG